MHDVLDLASDLWPEVLVVLREVADERPREADLVRVRLVALDRVRAEEAGGELVVKDVDGLVADAVHDDGRA